MADDEELDWNSSKIKGFSFGDDEETPFEELSKYQTISSSASGATSSSSDVFISFESNTPAGVVSDRVKAASRLFAKGLNDHEGGGGPSISDVVGSNVPDSFLPSDPKELRSELALARKQLAKLEQARYIPLHPKETVRNIFLGKRVSFEFYKSFKDKKDLLDEALTFADGDAILMTTLFVRRTLNRSKFLELMSTRPTCVRHLANYLETRMEISELTDLLTSLGQHEKAALIHYKQACAIQNIEARTKRIKSVLQSHFHGHPDSNLLIQHVHLLERISPVIEADKRNELITQDPVLPCLDPRNETVLGTLLYFCYHHWGVGENLLHSPQALRKIHSLSEKQITWISVLARAKRKSWKDVESLVITKSWLGGKKTKSSISIDGVVRILFESKAPSDILQTYLQLIDDLDDREQLARKCNVPNVVIDCLVLQRDRVALQNYRQRLTSKSQEWFYADHALNTTNTKWKN